MSFQFNSQATAMQFTQRPTLGGRAWLSITLKSASREKVLVLWANSSLGLLLYWWSANREQIGRGNIGKSVLQFMPVLAIDALTAEQIAAAEKLFDKYSKQQMRPMHEMDQDSIRRSLDYAIIKEVLGVPEALHWNYCE